MKKAAKPVKPAKKDARAHNAKRQANPIRNLIETLDEDELVTLLQGMMNAPGLAPDLFGPEDPVELFGEYLQVCAQGVAADDEKDDRLTELLEVLSELQIDCNGGDPQARGKIQQIYKLLEDAIENHELQAPDLMVIGKILFDAGWVVPDRLKQAMTEALRVPQPGMSRSHGKDLVSSLLEAADEAGQNPFVVHEYLHSLLASFPTDACRMLLSELLAGKEPAINQAVAGFVLHPDAVLAQWVTKILAARAGEESIESSLVERLMRMRPWLPQARQAELDPTISAMRKNALPPVKTDAPKIIKCYVSTCDGAGTRSVFVTQRFGRTYQIAAVMMKPTGVAEAMIIPKPSKSGMDDMVREMKSAIMLMEADGAKVIKMLSLAIADNVVSGCPPPFRLIEVVESLGLGPVHPDHSSPLEIFTELLADLPPEQTNPTAVAKAHADIGDSALERNWFEAGEALENLLRPVKGAKRRVARVLKDHLPGRRDFWARQCAISALAMQDDEKSAHALWKQLALVGRDIASGLPIDQIPLMHRISEVSVRAFESRS